jgi:type VI protein secretion system component Hcp
MLNLCLIPEIKTDICRLMGYEKWFFLESFSLTVRNETYSPAGTEFLKLKLTKDFDRCTPQLLAVCGQGKTFDSLSIDVIETSGSGISATYQPILRLRFGNLKVRNWSIDKSIETIEFDYLKVACMFSQGKFVDDTIETTYTDTSMMGWECFDEKQDISSAGDEWDISDISQLYTGADWNGK